MSRYSHEEVRISSPTPDTDLFFAMRGAGASYAIATEFLYKIHRAPETQPAVILVWVEDMKDLWRIQEAALRSTEYSITINNEYAGDFWNSFKTRIVYKFLPTVLNCLVWSEVVSIFLLQVLTSVKLLHRQGATPLFLTVTDIRPGAGLYTDPVRALRYLTRSGVDLVYRLPALVRCGILSFGYSAYACAGYWTGSLATSTT